MWGDFCSNELKQKGSYSPEKRNYFISGAKAVLKKLQEHADSIMTEARNTINLDTIDPNEDIKVIRGGIEHTARVVEMSDTFSVMTGYGVDISINEATKELEDEIKDLQREKDYKRLPV